MGPTLSTSKYADRDIDVVAVGYVVEVEVPIENSVEKAGAVASLSGDNLAGITGRGVMGSDGSEGE